MFCGRVGEQGAQWKRSIAHQLDGTIYYTLQVLVLGASKEELAQAQTIEVKVVGLQDSIAAG